MLRSFLFYSILGMVLLTNITFCRSKHFPMSITPFLKRLGTGGHGILPYQVYTSARPSVQSCRTELHTFSVVLQTLFHFILLGPLLFWPVNEPAALPLFLTSLGPMEKMVTQLYYVHKKNKKSRKKKKMSSMSRSAVDNE